MLLYLYIYVWAARLSPAAEHGVHTVDGQWPGAAFFGCLFELENWCAGYVLRQAGAAYLVI